MDAMASKEDVPSIPVPHDPYDRRSMCIGNKTEVLQYTDRGFERELSQIVESTESWMLERSVQLKRRLSNVSTYDFWEILVQGMAEVTGSQYAFVAKRVLHDIKDTAAKIPPIGEPGSCLISLAFYFNDRKGRSNLFRDYEYPVHGCPCQWMRHNRVLLIPDGLATLTPDNPNTLCFPIPAEGYLAVPLFHDGKCFAHFGCMWTADGLKERPKLSWSMLEMFLHALEDQVATRILEGLDVGDFENQGERLSQNLARGSGAIAVKHSLRPYARRLSHELRTPMQGVVGMLDVMYASVLEAIHPDRWRWPDVEQLKVVIEGLRASIEVAQDSSKRAVDAADNMVHAYDFNMEVPSTPSQAMSFPTLFGLEEPIEFFRDGYSNSEKDDDPSHRRNLKRRRSSFNSGRETPHKIPHIEHPTPPTTMILEPGCQTPPRNPYTSGSTSSSCTPQYGGLSLDDTSRSDSASDYFSHNVSSGQAIVGTPGLYYDAASKVVLNSRPLKLRELLHEAVHESLRTGGRPDFTKITETPRGERVIVEVAEARSGEEERKLVEIEVIVDETVPDSMISTVDGSYLMKMISSVFHNAFKFTPSGRITLNASVNSSRQIIFSIVDTGDGIPNDFIPNLFKPFTTEDESLTRHRDGLGLGLYVAKGIARKMGGDLWCERTSTEGDNRGSEFKIRLPITPADAFNSTPSTPTLVPAPDITVSLRPDTVPATKYRPPSPLARSVIAGPPPERKLSFDPELAKKLPLRILVVEDNRINRALLCSMLKRLGYRDIEEARDGVEAVEIFTSALLSSHSDAKRAFDLILMDLWMPRMDGYEAAERIVNLYNEKRKDRGISVDLETGITVLAVSADATEEARAKAALKGIHGFVGKPFGIADLGKAVMDFRGKDAFEERRLSTNEAPTPVN